MKKILFLDRDGILNIDTAYLSRYEDLQWMPHIIEALSLAKSKGYEFIVITNQSGVARGYFSEESVQEIHRSMKEYLKEYDLDILKFYYCPHMEGGKVDLYNKNCSCRKPKSGMLWQAFEEFPIDKVHSFMVGDSQRDVQCAEGAGIKGFLYTEGSILDFISDCIREMES